MKSATDQETIADFARAVLRKIDAPRARSEDPVKPAIAELFGLAKSGKDTTLVRLERLLQSFKFKVLVNQESAESGDIRSTSRSHPFAYEMRHLTYNISNLLWAINDRAFHAIFLNRGVIDNLCYLEWGRRKSSITEEEYKSAKEYILNGPWIPSLDIAFCVVCDVETALDREYGSERKNNPNLHYGSRMNGPALTLMRECIDTVFTEVGARFPNLSLVVVDTTSISEDEACEVIFREFILAISKRLKVDEDNFLPRADFMRDNARFYGPEKKIRGSVSECRLRELGWQYQADILEEDVYITPKGRRILENNECFHLRFHGDSVHLYYKRLEDHDRRSKIHIPIPRESVRELRAGFSDEEVVVKKDRKIFTRGGFVLDVDVVEGLGEFLEVKAPVSASVDDIMAIIMELGFTIKDIVTETYLQMRLKNKEAA